MAAKDPPSSSTVASLSIEKTRRAMEDFIRLFQANMSTLPWGQTALSKKLAGLAEQNLENGFRLAEKLTQAKDFQEYMAIQAEFFQSQLSTLAEQAKDIGETASKATRDAILPPIKPPS